MSDCTFEYGSVIRGHDTHRRKWQAEIGQQLVCEVELGNQHDTCKFTVSTISDIVGHVPQRHFITF